MACHSRGNREGKNAESALSSLHIEKGNDAGSCLSIEPSEQVKTSSSHCQMPGGGTCLFVCLWFMLKETQRDETHVSSHGMKQ